MGEWHCGHSDFGGDCMPHFARRDAARERDFLRLGTAIVTSGKTFLLLLFSLYIAPQEYMLVP